MPAVVTCPICGTQVPLDDPNMPFCSDRCRLLDLGNWASEKYVIGSESIDELEDNGQPRSPEDRSE